jgi:hypothetical protein
VRFGRPSSLRMTSIHCSDEWDHAVANVSQNSNSASVALRRARRRWSVDRGSLYTAGEPIHVCSLRELRLLSLIVKGTVHQHACLQISTLQVFDGLDEHTHCNEQHLLPRVLVPQCEFDKKFVIRPQRVCSPIIGL